MPNGYTAGIYEGDDSFKNYVTRVAKDFGAYYHQRDDGLDEPLKPLGDDSLLYHQRELDKAQTKYDDFTALDVNAQRKVWQEALKDVREANEKSNQEGIELASRYGELLAQTIAWTVPPELVNLKDKMRKYLEDSIDFDCNVNYNLPEPDFDKWLREHLRSLEWGIEYHSKEVEREKKCIAEQREWHNLLMDALKNMS